MHLREAMGYTSQAVNHWVDQEWRMRMLIKISKSPTKTHLRKISSQVHIRWMPLRLTTGTINCPNKYFSNLSEINFTTIYKHPWALVTNQSMKYTNIMNYLAYDQCTQYQKTKPRSMSNFKPWLQEYKHDNMI